MSCQKSPSLKLWKSVKKQWLQCLVYLAIGLNEKKDVCWIAWRVRTGVSAQRRDFPFLLVLIHIHDRHIEP